MSSTAAKTYITHPKTVNGEIFKISADYAHEALKTLSKDKVLDEELREKVQKIIEEKLPIGEYKHFRELIELHYVQGIRMEEIAKIMNVSIPQIYDWRKETAYVVMEELYFDDVLIEKRKKWLIDRLKNDPDMVAAVTKANNLLPTPTPKKRGRKAKS